MIRVVGLLLILGLAHAREAVPKILFFTHSAGFVHDVVRRKGDQLALAERQLIEAARGRFEVVCSQDDADITAESLKQYAAVVFYTTGELKIDADALVEWVKQGGAFVGIHCATDTLYKHPGYTEMIAGNFDGHPWHKKVKIKVEDRRHPATAHLGPAFEIFDEIYQFKNWDRKNVHVLMSLDLASADPKLGKREDKDYANGWTREFGKGRVFYTALGHGANAWRDARFLEHVLNGMSWAMKLKEPVNEEGFEPWTAGSKREFKNAVMRLEFRQTKPKARIFGMDIGEAADWKAVEIACLGKKIDLWIDGKRASAERAEGPMALEQDGVEFRNVRVHELPEDVKECGETLEATAGDCVVMLEWKGKLEVSAGPSFVREAADWSRLEIRAAGTKVRIYVNGLFEEEFEGERKKIEFNGGETRGLRVYR